VRVDYQFTNAQTALLPIQDTRNALFDATLPGLPQTKNLQLRAGLRWNVTTCHCRAELLESESGAVSSRGIANDRDRQPVLRTGVRPRTMGLTVTLSLLSHEHWQAAALRRPSRSPYAGFTSCTFLLRVLWGVVHELAVLERN